MYVPQLLYKGTDRLLDEGDTETEEPQIFGTVVLQCIIALTGDKQDIRALIRLVLRHAMIVADVWKYTAENGFRDSNELPFFQRYDLGLDFARTVFKHAVQEFADSEDDLLEWNLRNTLKIT
jgi:hypothetical protein